VFSFVLGRTTGHGLLAFPALAAILAVGAMGKATDAVGGRIAGFYCYNDGTVLEEQCRQFNAAGFYATAQVGSPAQNADLLGKAFLFTVDARGFVIAFCGLVAGLCAGYLVRRSSEST
jgi:hypothetical protein